MPLALMSLSWWFSMAREEKKLCVEALDDVCWMLEQMIATLNECEEGADDDNYWPHKRHR